MISLEYGKTLYKRESLIIFDEVQSFPRAREAIKHLVKDERYDYIETGTLISIKENTKNILIPSEEKSIQMYPMDFEEFAWALGEERMIEYIKQCFNDKKHLLEPLHKKAMFLFKQYLLVGGMPKVVNAYIEDNKQFENEKIRDYVYRQLKTEEVLKEMNTMLDGFKVTYAKISDKNLINNVLIKRYK